MNVILFHMKNNAKTNANFLLLNPDNMKRSWDEGALEEHQGMQNMSAIENWVFLPDKNDMKWNIKLAMTCQNRHLYED